MFERVAPSEEQRDAEAREGRSPDQVAALRLAALLIVLEELLGISAGLAFAGTRAAGQLIGVAIRLVMAYYLYKLRPRAEALALGLTILGGIVTLVGLASSLSQGFSIVPLLDAIPPLGVVGALLLLLIGDPPREKRIAAIVVFAILVALPLVLLLVLRMAHVLPGVPEGATVD
jgi:hypothetical protein